MVVPTVYGLLIDFHLVTYLRLFESSIDSVLQLFEVELLHTWDFQVELLHTCDFRLFSAGEGHHVSDGGEG